MKICLPWMVLGLRWPETRSNISIKFTEMRDAEIVNNDVQLGRLGSFHFSFMRNIPVPQEPRC
ncbi:hypothetical protein J6TS7_22190 [Paenibacillus dendritiformis]|nr:hypothetical protein J6TS7_22190 [Paenibacillus dendritiformis]